MKDMGGVPSTEDQGGTRELGDQGGTGDLEDQSRAGGKEEPVTNRSLLEVKLDACWSVATKVMADQGGARAEETGINIRKTRRYKLKVHGTETETELKHYTQKHSIKCVFYRIK